MSDDPRPRRKKRRRSATTGESPTPPASAQMETPVEASPEGEPAPASTEETEEPAQPGDQVPAFAQGWPRDPELDALVAAFEAGDYARVRRDAPALARRTEGPRAIAYRDPPTPDDEVRRNADNDAVRRAARELRRRLDPDPVAVYMLMAAAALLVFLAGWYWLHPHTP